MNWQEIYEKYPRSWNKLALRFLIRIYDGRLVDVGCEVDNPKLMCNFNLRNLYDFFDEQGIRIAIYIDKEFYGYSLNDIEGYMLAIDDEGVFHSRVKAEEQAFLKAFEILESRL